MSGVADQPARGTEQVLDQAGDENFPVATRILPPSLRSHLMALYGFARLVDDIGDEAPGDRSALLDVLAGEVRRIERRQSAYLPAADAPGPTLLDRLARTVVTCAIPVEPLYRLIEANRRDQVVTDYATFAELRRYCHLSADPVGELVLHVLGRADPGRIARSDRICTALQLVEHWQDVAQDRRNGRIYLPREDRVRFGVADHDLDAPAIGTPGAAKVPATPELRALITFEVDRARAVLRSGAGLVSTLTGFARLAVGGYVAGGLAALDAVDAAGGDVLGGAPRATRRAVGAATVRTVLHGGR